MDELTHQSAHGLRLAPEVGIGYTLATGELYCRFADFHGFAETLLGRPIWMHEFASQDLWREMRVTFEERVKRERPLAGGEVVEDA